MEAFGTNRFAGFLSFVLIAFLCLPLPAACPLASPGLSCPAVHPTAQLLWLMWAPVCRCCFLQGEWMLVLLGSGWSQIVSSCPRFCTQAQYHCSAALDLTTPVRFLDAQCEDGQNWVSFLSAWTVLLPWRRGAVRTADESFDVSSACTTLVRIKGQRGVFFHTCWRSHW